MEETIKLELKPPVDYGSECKSVELEIINPVNEVDARLDEIEGKIADLDISIDKLTNHADKLDYAVAVSSGILTGLLDVFLGEYIKKIANQAINNQVIDAAKNDKIKESIKKAEEQVQRKGQKLSADVKENIRKNVEAQFSPQHNDQGIVSAEEEKRILSKAIRYFEYRKESPTDSVWNYKGSTITADSHHIDDLSHHASLVGLIASIMTQFTKHGYFSDHSAKYLPLEIDASSGSLIGHNVPTKIICGFTNWFWHLASDVAGTSGKNAGAGMGIPGPMVSLAKEISMLPGIKKTDLSECINNVFKDGMDFRSEMAQSIPVLMNEIFIRIFYSVRRFIAEYKSKKPLAEVNWGLVISSGNRTFARMLTISTGVFEAVDVLDALVEGAIYSKANWAEFGRQVVLRLNFVGIGRFTIALGTDAFMGLRKGKKSRERMLLKAESLYLLEAKMYYGESLMWSAVKDANQSVDSLCEAVQNLSLQIAGDMKAVQGSVNAIAETDVSAIEEQNKGLTADLLDII